MRKLLTASLVAGLCSAGLTAGVTDADRPAEFTTQNVFTEPNPCDPAVEHTVTIDFHWRLHEHENNVVGVIKSTESTTSGFEGSGHQTFVANNNKYVETQNHLLTNAESGEKYRVNGHVTYDFRTGEVQVDRFRIWCLTG